MRALATTCLISLLTFGCGSGLTATVQQPTEVVSRSESTLPAVLVRRPPRSSGDLDGDRAGRFLARQAQTFAACYESAGGTSVGEGVVYLLIDVEADGRVTRTTIGHSDIRSVRFETCLRRALHSLRLPESNGGTVLQTHLVFGAQDFAQGRDMMQAYRASRGTRPAGSNQPETVALSGLRTRIQSCYERTRRDRPWLRGRMVLELTVQQDGLVSEASVSDGGFDGRLTSCVLGAVRNLRIEGDYASAATLQYPVILEPGR